LDTQRKKSLLIKYLNNDYSEQELDELLHYVKGINKDKAIEEGLEEVWTNVFTYDELSRNRSDQMFSSIMEKAEEIEGRSRRVTWHQWYKIAAVFIGALVLASIAFFAIEKNGYEEIKTGYGQTRNVLLPDGSRVTLNGNSSLKYKNNWTNSNTREVSLEGEAFFEVTHKTNNQKFLVVTRDLKVEVLGTQFNVMSRKTRSMVLLKEGSVKLDLEGKEGWIMKPGEMVEVDQKTTTINKKMVNPENFVSWRNNTMVFQSNSLLEIAQLIEENYDLKITIADQTLANERFTGAFPLNENIDVLLEMLAKSYHFKIEKTGDTIVFRSLK
jgi:transmembrane sensor